jgi:hypothetical protein
MEPVVLITCQDAIEANIFKGVLENAGLECYLSGENFSAVMPTNIGAFGGGVQVLVDENDFEKAKLLIKE